MLYLYAHYVCVMSATMVLKGTTIWWANPLHDVSLPYIGLFYVSTLIKFHAILLILKRSSDMMLKRECGSFHTFSLLDGTMSLLPSVANIILRISTAFVYVTDRFFRSLAKLMRPKMLSLRREWSTLTNNMWVHFSVWQHFDWLNIIQNCLQPTYTLYNVCL